MSMRLLVALVLGLLISPLVASAQPGPDHKKMEAGVGKWRVEVDVKASAAAPASKISGTEECSWFANLHVVCRTEGTGPAGLYTNMRTMSWVPSIKQYAVYTIDSLGYAVLAMGTVSGETWTLMTELPGVKLRQVIKMSRDSFTSTSEYAGADGKWVQTAVTKGTRMK